MSIEEELIERMEDTVRRVIKPTRATSASDANPLEPMFQLIAISAKGRRLRYLCETYNLHHLVAETLEDAGCQRWQQMSSEQIRSLMRKLEHARDVIDQGGDMEAAGLVPRPMSQTKCHR